MIIVRGLFFLLLLLYSLLSAIGLPIMLGWHFSIIPVIAAAVFLIWIGSGKKTGPIFLLLVFNTATTAFYLQITPQEQFRGVKWESCCAIKPEVFFMENGKIKINHIRDFQYRSAADFDVKYKNIVYDINKLESLDIGVSHWDGMDFISHVMLCFNFRDGKELVLSVEMRCPDGGSRDYYTTLLKQHELIYIWGSAEDLFDLRSTYRDNEAFYRYRTTATENETKTLFIQLLKRTQQLYFHPEFYRLISGNCTTELLPALQKMRPSLKWDWRVLINGTIDRMFFEQGFLQCAPGEKFEPLRARSIVPEKSDAGKVVK